MADQPAGSLVPCMAAGVATGSRGHKATPRAQSSRKAFRGLSSADGQRARQGGPRHPKRFCPRQAVKENTPASSTVEGVPSGPHGARRRRARCCRGAAGGARTGARLCAWVKRPRARTRLGKGGPRARERQAHGDDSAERASRHRRPPKHPHVKRWGGCLCQKHVGIFVLLLKGQMRKLV